MPTDDELSSFTIERVPFSEVKHMDIYTRGIDKERGKELIVLCHGFLNPDDTLKIKIPDKMELSFYAKEGHKVFGSLPRAVNGITAETLHGGDMTYNYTLSDIGDDNIEQGNISILNENYIYSFRLIEYLKNEASKKPITLQKPEKAFLYFSYQMYNDIKKYKGVDIAVLGRPYYTKDYINSIDDPKVRAYLRELNTIKSEDIIREAEKLGYKKISFLHCRAVGYTQDLPHPIITESLEKLAGDFEYLNNLNNLKYKLFNDREEKSTSTHSLPGIFGKTNGGNSGSTHSMPTKVPLSYSVRNGVEKTLRTTGRVLRKLALTLVETLDGGGFSASYNQQDAEFDKPTSYRVGDAFSKKKMTSIKNYEDEKRNTIKTEEIKQKADSEERRKKSIRFTMKIEEILKGQIEDRIQKMERSNEHHGSKSQSTHHPPPSTNSSISTTNSTISTNSPNSSISTNSPSSVAPSAPPLEILETVLDRAPVVPSAPLLEVIKEVRRSPMLKST